MTNTTMWANDPINNPKHYLRAHPGMECIDLTADCSFCMGNAIKCMWRYRLKGRPLEDLEKARWYLCRLIDRGEKIAWTYRQEGLLVRLRGDAETGGDESEYRFWRDLAVGDADGALANLERLIDRLIEQERRLK